MGSLKPRCAPEPPPSSSSVRRDSCSCLGVSKSQGNSCEIWKKFRSLPPSLSLSLTTCRRISCHDLEEPCTQRHRHAHNDALRDTLDTLHPSVVRECHRVSTIGAYFP